MRTKSLLFGLCSRARLCSPCSAVAAGAGTVTSTWRCRGAGLPGASGAPDEVTGLGRVWVELPVGACAEHELPVPGGCAGRPPARPRHAPARALACACSSPPKLWLWRRCGGSVIRSAGRTPRNGMWMANLSCYRHSSEKATDHAAMTNLHLATGCLEPPKPPPAAFCLPGARASSK